VAILPVPYDATTYYRPGAKDGPGAIVDASRRLELFDLDSGQTLKDDQVFTLEELEPSKNSPRETIERVAQAVGQILKDKKIPLVLGGEHSITLGPVLAFKKAKKASSFSVLQIDAHTDLRDEFEDTKYHHACVMRRVRENVNSVVQAGIRSLCQEERDFLKKKKIDNVFFAPGLSADQIIPLLKKEVYLTFDLDALDPSIMPATGTPEPGGLGWYETLDFLTTLFKQRKIIGADLVELSPLPGQVAPDFLAAKLALKIILAMLNQKL
jgi:agmatinase